VKQRCITCALETLLPRYPYCLAKGKETGREERIKPNLCPEYQRMEKAVSTPPYPLRGRRRK
jgi:hypothetical protein